MPAHLGGLPDAVIPATVKHLPRVCLRCTRPQASRAHAAFHVAPHPECVSLERQVLACGDRQQVSQKAYTNARSKSRPSGVRRGVCRRRCTACRPHRAFRLAPTTLLESTCTPRVRVWMEWARLEDRSLLKDADTRTASIPKLAGRRVGQLVQGLRERRRSVAGQDSSRCRASGYKTRL